MGDPLQIVSDPPEGSESDGPECRLRAFVDLAKRSPALKGIVWDDVEWVIDKDDASTKKIRVHRTYRPTLTFTTRESSSRGMSRRSVHDRTPLCKNYAEFAKADIRLYHATATKFDADYVICIGFQC